MNLMKRTLIAALLLTVSSVFSLAGCGDSGTSTDTNKPAAGTGTGAEKPAGEKPAP
jgi:predicted small lipoprotein YifL